MWICPKCNRKFKNMNQSHYCGEKPETIDEYIMVQEDYKQQDLICMRDVLRHSLPEADEKISWSMPTFWQGHNIVHFAASKNHIGFYPGPAAVAFFSEELKKYKTSKGTIQIPYGQIDIDLVEKIAKWCLETGNHA